MKLPFDFLNERKSEIDNVLKEDVIIENRSSVPVKTVKTVPGTKGTGKENQ